MVIMSSVIRIRRITIIMIDSEHTLNPTDDTTNCTPDNGSNRSGSLIADTGPVGSATRDTLSPRGKRQC
jgi:hypothetical protein